MSQVFNFFSTHNPVGLRLLVELLTKSAELPADSLADVRDFAFDAFEVLPLHNEQTSSLVFQCDACDTTVCFFEMGALGFRTGPDR